jgi:hypothetical protein
MIEYYKFAYDEECQCEVQQHMYPPHNGFFSYKNKVLE